MGILQRVSDKARWGVEFFDTTGKEGGSIGARVIGTSMITLNQDLQDKACGTWTPLAESYFVAMKYYMQKKITEISGYSTNEPPCANAGDDPYLLDGKEIYCAKSFVLLITDGASTQDQAIPSAYKDYDGEKNAKLKFFHDDSIVPTFGSSGSSYLADLALYAKVTDLRSSTIGKNNLEGNQNIILYPVYAFGDNSYDSKAARALLKTTAMNGGFEDRNGNNKPDFDLPEEWDRDGDGIPDNYYEATDGYALEAQLARAINDILKRSASGTAVASTVTSEEGEGTALQAYFKPTLTNDDMTEEISWVGYVQSLWLDYYGNLREDTDQDLALDIGTDKIVKTYLEPGTGEVRARLYDVSADAPYPDTSDGSNSTFYTVPLEELRALWKGDERLRD
ncbi:MAG: hypothetical protein EOM25_14975 [Deltaproteobacteria bacterium]|nr:hypothetical protein [Deltaproteobacteria bacterium]